MLQQNKNMCNKRLNICWFKISNFWGPARWLSWESVCCRSTRVWQHAAVTQDWGHADRSTFASLRIQQGTLSQRTRWKERKEDTRCGPRPPKACVHIHNTPEHTHILTVIVITYTNPMQAQTRTNPSTERGSGHGVPPLAEALLEMDGFWERRGSVL